MALVVVTTPVGSVISLLSISPLRTVILVSQSRWSRAVSVPSKPPYTATPSFNTKEIVRSVVVVGLCTPILTHILSPLMEALRAVGRAQASPQLLQLPLPTATGAAYRTLLARAAPTRPYKARRIRLTSSSAVNVSLTKRASLVIIILNSFAQVTSSP